MFLPALGKAGTSSTWTGDVAELAGARVGVFDTKIVVAKTPNALLDWLRDNQFSVPTNAKPVIGDYVIRQTANGYEFVWFDANGGER